MNRRSRLRLLTERRDNQLRPKIRATDTDVDHIVEVATCTHGIRESQQPFSLLQHHRFDRRAADGITRRLTQSHMQHCAIFRGVDAIAAPHLVYALAQLDHIGQT